MTLILTKIGQQIKPTRFLKASLFKIVLDIDEKILKKLVVIEKICAKLIFTRFIDLDWSDHYKFVLLIPSIIKTT